MKKVSLKDIAQKVGVSTATVSYVLSNKKCRVGESTKQKIREIAKELNYQPNQIAKSLKSGKTFTFGLIVADISNPFFANIARVIEDEAAKHDYTVIFGSSDESAQKSWKLIQFLQNRQVDGFIIVPTENSEEQIEYLQKQNIPFVLLDRYFPQFTTNNVVINNYEAAFMMVSKLVQKPKSNVGMIAYKNSLIHMKERIQGFEEATKKHHRFIEKISFAAIDQEIGNAIENMLENNVEALFFATNTLAIAGLKVLQQKQIKIPNQLKMASFDESEAFDFFYSPISFIEQPIKNLGETAIGLLMSEINSTQTEKTTKVLPAKCIERASSK